MKNGCDPWGDKQGDAQRWEGDTTSAFGTVATAAGARVSSECLQSTEGGDELGEGRAIRLAKPWEGVCDLNGILNLTSRKVT